jgi:hypothetical protein
MRGWRQTGLSATRSSACWRAGMTDLRVEMLRVGDIPALLAIQAGAQRCPVVFVVPGYGLGKEACLNLAYRLYWFGKWL